MKNLPRIIRSIIFLPVLGALVAGALGYLYASGKPQVYSASNAIIVTANPQAAAHSNGDATTLISTQVQNFQNLVATPLVLDPVVQKLSLPDTADDLAGSVSAAATLNTSIIELTVTNADPKRAAAIVNATQASLVNVIAQVSPRTVTGVPQLSATVVSTAPVPQTPQASGASLYALLGLFVGTLAGIGCRRILVRFLDERQSRRDTGALDPRRSER